MGQVIKKHYSTKNEIHDGKVLVQWRGDNLEEVEVALTKALKSVKASKTNTVWLSKKDYAEIDAREAERKSKTKSRRSRTVFSMSVG